EVLSKDEARRIAANIAKLSGAKSIQSLVFNVATWTVLVPFLGSGQLSQRFRSAFAPFLGSSLTKSRPCSAKSAHHGDRVLYSPSESNGPRWLDTCPRYAWRCS